MSHAPDVLLCRYRYDPLDRLAGREGAGQGSGQCFYQKNRLTTEIQGQFRRSWLQTPQQLLAQQRCTADISETALIGTDIQGSVLHGLDASRPQAYAYSVYGSRHPALDPLHLPGFNRERVDPITGHYLLGNGYRAFNPLLMRFNSPDSLSPFGRGGLNAYAYCAGDPVNRVDPSGHLPNPWKGLLNKLGLRKSSKIKDIERLDRMYTQFREASTQGYETMPSGLVLDKSKRKAFAAEAEYEAEILRIGGLDDVGDKRYAQLLYEAEQQEGFVYKYRKLLLRADVKAANKEWGKMAAFREKTTKLTWAEGIVEPSTRKRREFKKSREERLRIRRDEGG